MWIGLEWMLFTFDYMCVYILRLNERTACIFYNYKSCRNLEMSLSYIVALEVVVTYTRNVFHRYMKMKRYICFGSC